MKKILSFISAFILVLCMAVSAFSFAACDTGDRPPVGDGTDRTEKVTLLSDMSAPKFLAKAYNATVGNFTLELTLNDGGKSGENVGKIKYDEKTGYEISSEIGETLYGDGLQYVSTREEDGVSYPYAAYETENAFLPAKINETDLTDMIDLALTYAGMTDLQAKGGENERVLKIEISLEDTLNALIGIAKNDIDEPLIKALTDAANEFIDEDITQSELSGLIVYCLDTDLNTVLSEGKFIDKLKFMSLYLVMKDALKEVYELPSFNDFMKAYGDMTLGQVLETSGEELTSFLSSTTLRQYLSEFEYTEGTWADFFASDLPTAVKNADITLTARAGADNKMKDFSAETRFEATAVPVFKAALAEDATLTETSADIDIEYLLKGEFSDIGTTVVEMPKDYAVVGEKTVFVSGGGSYGFRRGNKNTPYGGGSGQTAATVKIDSSQIAEQDRERWLDAVRAVTGGIAVDYERNALTVSEDAYENMLLTRELGMTKLEVAAFEELTFVLDF